MRFDLPAKPVVVMPLGDIQFAGMKDEGTAMGLLKERIALGQRLGAYYLGMGDYIDTMSPSNRQRFKSAALYDTTLNVIDNAVEALNQELFEAALAPTKGRWLGMLAGHHYHQFESGDTSDMRLARMLGARFLGTTAYIGLRFKRANSTSSCIVNIWATHGAGGGGRAYAPVAKLENVMPAWEAHVFVMGHATKLASCAVNRVYPVWDSAKPYLSHRTVQLVGAGGFSKSYIEGARQGQVPMDSYVAKGMMKPTALGCPIIRINPRRETTRTKAGVQDRFTPEITVEM